MTKKDYILIASAFKRDAVFLRPELVGKTYQEMPDWQKGAYDQWHTLVLEMADLLGEANPRFDRATFLTACGVQ